MGAKKKILLAAEELFADCGYTLTTVKMICEKSGVNIASVNYHFNSKSELYLAVLESVGATAASKLEQLLLIDVSTENSKSWQEFIHEFVSLILLNEDEKSERWYKITLRELSTPSEMFDNIYDYYITPPINFLSDLFAQFHPALSEESRFMWITTLLSQLCFIKNSRGLLIKERGESFYSEENMTVLVNHISNTICPPVSTSTAKIEGTM